MHLILRAETKAPEKQLWHNPDQTTRGHWSEIYEAVTSWFCSSHDFNKVDDVIILFENSLIKLQGDAIKYLAPSMRSAASLIHKAFVKLDQIDGDGVVESTPGIFVYKQADLYMVPKPYYTLKLSNKIVKYDISSEKINEKGSLFTFDRDETQEYYAPASRISQGLVWFLQERWK